MRWQFQWTSKLVHAIKIQCFTVFFLQKSSHFLGPQPHKPKPKSKTHSVVFNCYIPPWILKLSSIPSFKINRWAVKADIFLLSPQRTPSTWQHHQLSKSRLLQSSISLFHPSFQCAEWALKHRRETNTYHHPLIQTSAFLNYHAVADISQNLNTKTSFESRVPDCTRQYRLVKQEGDTRLQHWLGFSWEAGTK